VAPEWAKTPIEVDRASAGARQLDRNSTHWKELQASGGFAVHVSGDFPNLNIELWAIRG